jgi:hypothetical protein
MRQTANVKLLYDVYERRTNDHAYIDNGIRGVEFIIHPEAKYSLSLDAIFKIIHCSEYIPFIKFNPGKRLDNIYKLFTSGISRSGRKIPFLPKSDIFRLIKTTARKKGVAIYIQYTYSNPANPNHKANHLSIPIICEFETDGSIYVKSYFKYSFTTEEIENIIKATVNPVLKVVKEYIEQSGFTMSLFTKLYKDNIDIVNIEYFAQLPITRNIEIKTMIKCISSVFNEIEGSLKKGIMLRYKRVSNYNEMTSQEAYIIEMLNKRNIDRDIIDGLRENYMLEEDEARMKIANLMSSIQTQQLSRYRGGTIRIKNNPGFLTKLTKGQFNNIITVEISNINNIMFLPSLQIYIDSIIRIYQDPNSTEIPFAKISELCRGTRPDSSAAAASASSNPAPSPGTGTGTPSSKLDAEPSSSESKEPSGRGDKEESVEGVAEIVSTIRKPLSESVSSSIIGDEVVFGFEAKSSNAEIDLFELLQGDDDEDDDDSDADEDDEGGGGGAAGGGMGGGSGRGKGASASAGAGAVVVAKGRSKKQSMASGVESESDEDEDAHEDMSDITGMELANPNPFSKRIQERDPIIHLNEDSGKFNAYSRSCPWNYRRQPVILTSEEKARIDREHPGSYSQSITYGSDSAKQYHYICPRYWSLKDNTSLTDDEVKSGRYGKIIPQKAKKIPPGANVFEFTDDKYHKDEKGEYKQHYPGFLKKDAHPKGLCVPCCFGQWDKPSQTLRRQECEMKQHEEIKIKQKLASKSLSLEDASAASEGAGAVASSHKLSSGLSSSAEMMSVSERPSSEPGVSAAIHREEVVKITEMKDDRILSSEKFPLDNNRWGYLPVQVQKFLFTDSRNCQVSLKNTAIKKDTPCLLRRGVESHDKQSFISAVAYYYKENIGLIKTIVGLPEVATRTSSGTIVSHTQADASIKDTIESVAASAIASGTPTAASGTQSFKQMIAQSISENIKKHASQINEASAAGGGTPFAKATAMTPKSASSAAISLTADTRSNIELESGYHSEDETPVPMTPRLQSTSTPMAPSPLASNPMASNAEGGIAGAASSHAPMSSFDNVPTIREMRQIIIQSLDIDRFITLQNATLVDVFYNKKTEIRDTSKYHDSEIYDKLHESSLDLFKKMCNAYENFISYLDNDNVVIDHTYLWDIVTQPNPKLFKNGNNIILIQIPDDDTTNNVQVICPTNAYSGEVFDANKKTIIIMKHDKYYEPIYLFESKSNGKFNVLGRFAIKSKTIMPKIKHMIENIRDLYFSYCRLYASQPRQYKYVLNKPAKQVAKILKDAGFKIESQVLNYNGKVIGLYVKQTISTVKSKPSQAVSKEYVRRLYQGFIPTAVSAPLINGKNDDPHPHLAGDMVGHSLYEYPIVMMDSDELWPNSYRVTVEFLNQVADHVKKTTKQVISCRPKVKVVEDGIIIGVITETNQFIQVNIDEDPQLNQNDGIPTITEGNQLVADKEIMTQKEGAVDKTRDKYVRNIRLETNFYNVFRNTARIVLNKPENKSIKDEIDKIIGSIFMTYSNKLSQVVVRMKRLLTKYIGFIRYNKATLSMVGEVSGCITSDENTCGKKSYCIKESGGLCKLLLPQRNLMYQDIDNEIAYFGKLSDEMIRYERVKLFMFEPTKYITFQETKYDLYDDEIILLESLITQEYFENLEPVDYNPYVNQSSFYTINPNATTGALIQTYDNVYRKGYVDKYLELEKGASVAIESGAAGAAIRSSGSEVSGVEVFHISELNHVLGFCNQVSKRKVTEKMRQLFFPLHNTHEILFSNQSEECSFDVILTVLRSVAQNASKCPSGHTCQRAKRTMASTSAGAGAAQGGVGAGGDQAEDTEKCQKCRTLIGAGQTEFACFQCKYFVCDNCQHAHVDELGNMTITKIKEILAVEYSKLSKMPTFDKKITTILNGYGMKKYANLILEGRATLPQIIQSQNYFLTNVDVWILALYFKIPIVFVSQSLLIENGQNILVLYGDETISSYYFIHPFGVSQDTISRFALIEEKLSPELHVIKIPLTSTTQELQDIISREIGADDPFTLEKFITTFKISNIKNKPKPKLVKSAADDDADAPAAAGGVAGGGGGMALDNGILVGMSKIDQERALFQ